MYDSILVPTDGSEGSAEAVAEAAELAATTGATVHGLYVVDTRDYSALSEAQWLTVEDELRAAGESALEEVTERAAAAGVDADTALSRGVPHEEILGYAEETGVDLDEQRVGGRNRYYRPLALLLGAREIAEMSPGEVRQAIEEEDLVDDLPDSE